MTRLALRLVSAAALAVMAWGCDESDGGSPDASVASLPPVTTADDSGGEAGANFGLGSIDRAGRPLVGVLLIPGALEDEYNAAPTFDQPLGRTLADGVSSRLADFDGVALGDGGPDPIDWPFPDGGEHPLLAMFGLDALLVDTALPCGLADGGFAPSYLDIEREIFLSGATHTTCGGRTPNEPVVDETLTLLVTGDRDGGSVSQGIAGATKPAITQFPYLSDPND
jgi:hypothetical protein